MTDALHLAAELLRIRALDSPVPLQEPLRLRRQARCSTASVHTAVDARRHVIRTRARLSSASSAARPTVAARRVPSPPRPRTAGVSPKTDSRATAHYYHPARARARPIPPWPYACERDVLESVLFSLRAHAFVLCRFANSPAIPDGNAQSRLQPPAVGAQRRDRRRPVCAAHACRDKSPSGCDWHGRYVCLITYARWWQAGATQQHRALPPVSDGTRQWTRLCMAKHGPVG